MGNETVLGEQGHVHGVLLPVLGILYCLTVVFKQQPLSDKATVQVSQQKQLHGAVTHAPVVIDLWIPGAIRWLLPGFALPAPGGVLQPRLIPAKEKLHHHRYDDRLLLQPPHLLCCLRFLDVLTLPLLLPAAKPPAASCSSCCHIPSSTCLCCFCSHRLSCCLRKLGCCAHTAASLARLYTCTNNE